MIIPIIGKQFPDLVIPLIEQAKSTIEIVVFDWRWYPNDAGASIQKFNHAIIAAKRRGVQVRAVSNMTDTAKILNENGCEVRKFHMHGLVHAKLMIIDSRHVIVGSHNYTVKAFTENQEISVILEDCEVVQPFLRFFNSLFENGHVNR